MILIMCYHMLKYKLPYKELGPNSLDTRKKDRVTKNHIKKLTSLGFTVTVNQAAWVKDRLCGRKVDDYRWLKPRIRN